MVNGGLEGALQPDGMSRGDSRDKELVIVRENLARNRHNLFRRFPSPEDHFRKALAKGSVGVDHGERKLLDGRRAEGIEGLRDGCATIAHRFEELSGLFRGHEIEARA
jgi:hypothetical protein